MQDFQNNKIITYLIDDRYRFLRHVSFLFGFLLIFYYRSHITQQLTDEFRPYFLFSIWSIFMLMFYLNMYLLVPVFFFNSQYLLYLLMLIILVILCLTLTAYLTEQYLGLPRTSSGGVGQQRFRTLHEGIIISIPIILLTTALKLFQRWIKDNERILELKNIALTMELNELKNQINPHFLFNTLNNVKALIRKNPEKATETILKLSDFLRYQLYENNDDKTSLASEIKFISNFLNLEKIRREKFSVQIIAEIENATLNSIKVPPNLFTTFVENAVKHSRLEDDIQTFVKIRFYLQNEELYFICRNSKSQTPINMKHCGLGLKNTSRRLKLLYGDTYVLKIESNVNVYNVKLKIPLR